MGIGPYFGQAVHFKHFAPEPKEYAVNRDDFVAKRYWGSLPHVKRLLDEINARPAAQRAEALKAKHSFKAQMDDEARRAMFPQNGRLAK
jgi:GSH-dependent disulfide-bond oxidoreductase